MNSRGRVERRDGISNRCEGPSGRLAATRGGHYRAYRVRPGDVSYLTGVLLLCGVLAVLLAGAQPAAARQKPGPVTIRGVIAALAHEGFTLRTARQGTYSVETQRATRIDEKGKRGPVRLQVGDHVGVRGFVTAHLIRAIDVRVYPTKPPERSLRGVIVLVSGNRLVVLVEGKRVEVALAASTTITASRGRGSRGALRPGSRVEIRAAGNRALTAIHIHVFVRAPPAKRLKLDGTLAAVGGSSITVVSGTRRWTVAVTRETAVHRGNARSRASALRSGERVTVYACCAGSTLRATSIHIRAEAAAQHEVTLHGKVIALSDREMRVAAAGGAVSIELSRVTRYEIGTRTVGRRDVWIGDRVSVRAAREGSRLEGVRIHVLIASRRPVNVAGRVLATNRRSVTVESARGKRYVIQVGDRAGISLNGKWVALSAIQRGDRARLSARPAPGGMLVTDRLTALRDAPRPKLVTVRGTLVWMQGTSLIIDEGHGVRRRVQLRTGVRAELHGRPAPSAALFAGVQVRARGYLHGTTLQAKMVTVSVHAGSVHGRVTRASVAALEVVTSTGRAEAVDLPAGISIRDGHHRLATAALRAGVYVLARGYRQSASALRAVSVAVDHPSIDSGAIVLAVQPDLVVRTSPGQRFQLRLAAGAAVRVSRVGIPLGIRDIPVGAHAHVQGRVDSQGVLVVESMIVRLPSVRLRGKVSVDAGGSWMIRSGAETYSVHLVSAAPITQGSHILSSADVESGDDVTVEGYALTGHAVLGRRILVHRARVGLDGVVAAIEVDGFVLHAADGDHRVVVGPATVYTGTQVSVTTGLRVHVSGYQRGDGVILAAHVRVQKSPKAALADRIAR